MKDKGFQDDRRGDAMNEALTKAAQKALDSLLIASEIAKALNMKAAAEQFEEHAIELKIELDKETGY